ncbi:MAG: DUF3488 domain-containing transglutaminase family protein [Pseudomonadales bacterium]|nr:DUF3488 domain-containing transglutaminase family protein [Pseudomonadales bacterium]
MTPVFQLSRQSLWCLFIVQLLLILPHLGRLPLWLPCFYGAALFWRYGVYSGRFVFPLKWQKAGLLLIFVSGIVLSFRQVFALDSLIAVLLGLSSLKLLEMYYKRDALVWVFVSIFILMTVFLFSQSIFSALYVFIVLSLILVVYISFYRSPDSDKDNFGNTLQLVKLSSSMLLQSIPLMIVMFLVFPRLGSLWSVPLQSDKSKTGMSDTLRPGDINNLTQSKEVAFRVTFNGDIPSNDELYWRGLVLNHFDGLTWEQYSTGHVDEQIIWAGSRSGFMPDRIKRGEMYADYEIILEPSYRYWLFALATPIPQTAHVGLTSDFRLMKDSPINARFKYKVQSFRVIALEPEMDARRIYIETALPENANPKTRSYVQSLREQVPDDDAYIKAVLNMFHQDFFYTLKPPLLGQHSVDDFLFNTKKGFCEHFASSFAFMMRAAGIPARVIAGYQGGEINPYEGYLLVHQYDAHAWVEVWLEDKGWVRIDPTAAVAPQRILDGFRDSFLSTSPLESPFSLDSYRGLGFINELRLQADRVNYLWARWVLGYDNKLQEKFLSNLLGEYSVKRIAIASALFAGVFFILLSAYIYWKGIDRTRPAVIRVYQKFCKRIAKKGMQRQVGESPLAFAHRVKQAFPDSGTALDEITSEFYALAYNADGNDNDKTDADALKSFKAKVNAFNLRV